MRDLPEHDGNTWATRARWAFAVFAIVGAFFLLAEHRAHVLPFLPWLIFLACPLMHMFMHGGHGGHGGHHGGGKPPSGGNGVPTGAKSDGDWEGSVGTNGAAHSNHGGRS
jgi:hypothetical protein